MNKLKTSNNIHYVQIDKRICNGCVLCMKVCPTRAIRVRGGKIARIEEFCIDCGECIRACPRGAISAITADDVKIEKQKTVLSVSPVLYTQFGPDVIPSEVDAALKKIGFYDVYDQSETLEMFNVAVELYIKENRTRPGVPRPLISPVCPVVVRLIAYRFPSLLKHIPPLIPPREMVAREAKKLSAKKYKVSEDQIKVYHVTPCSAKMISIANPLLVEHSYLQGAISINRIYHDVVKHLKQKGRYKGRPHSSGVGIGWCMSGGEIAGMEDGNFLAVSGMQETIRYLEKIEMGLLDQIDYIEFRTCAEGCIGGPLTVCDKYQAKYTIQRFVRMFGPERTVKCGYLKQLYRKGWYLTNRDAGPPAKDAAGRSFSEAIERQGKVEEIQKLLPGKQCGVCGSPDCQTFAEDVVDRKVSLTSCTFLKKSKKRGENT